jgi:Kinesin motor domain
VATFIDSANCDSGILAYGATGSGKTYTTQGTRKNYSKPIDGVVDNEVLPEDGVLQRCLQQILEVRQQHGEGLVLL